VQLFTPNLFQFLTQCEPLLVSFVRQLLPFLLQLTFVFLPPILQHTLEPIHRFAQNCSFLIELPFLGVDHHSVLLFGRLQFPAICINGRRLFGNQRLELRTFLSHPPFVRLRLIPQRLTMIGQTPFPVTLLLTHCRASRSDFVLGSPTEVSQRLLFFGKFRHTTITLFNHLQPTGSPFVLDTVELCSQLCDFARMLPRLAVLFVLELSDLSVQSRLLSRTLLQQLLRCRSLFVLPALKAFLKLPTPVTLGITECLFPFGQLQLQLIDLLKLLFNLTCLLRVAFRPASLLALQVQPSLLDHLLLSFDLIADVTNFTTLWFERI
jgi:hypothetical protein